jgi:outer membrane protein assembly factor BamB
MHKASMLAVATVTVGVLAGGCGDANSTAEHPASATSSFGGPVSTPTASQLPGYVAAAITTGQTPSEISHGFGSEWVVTHRGSEVDRIDPATNQITARIHSAGTYLVGIAIGAGHVWYLDAEKKRIEGIDPATNKITTVARVGSDGGGVAATSAGVWFAGTSGEILRIDPSSGRTLDRRRLVAKGSGLGGPTVDGSRLWVTDPDHSRLFWLNASTLQLERTDHLKGDIGVAQPAFGKLWVGGWDGPLLYEMDPATGHVLRTIHISAGDHLAVGSKDLYLRAGDQIIRVLDPATGKFVRSYRDLPASEIPGGGIDVWHGTLWAVNWTAQSVWRIRAR